MPFDLTDLMEAVPSPPMQVDPAEVLADGHRRQRRRRRQTLIACVGVAALLGAGGALEMQTRDRGTPSSTITSSTVTVPLKKNLFSFRLDSDGRVQFGRVVQGTNRVVSEVAATPVNGQAWVVAKDRPNVVLGVAPAMTKVSEVDAVTQEARGEFYGSPDETFGNGMVAYVREFSSDQDAASFRGRVFLDGQGRVHGPGGVLPVATFAVSGPAGQVSVWLDARVRMFGSLAQGHLSARVRGFTADGIAVQDRDTSTSGVVTGRAYGMVPRGSKDLRLDFSTDAQVLTPIRTTDMGPDWVAFLVDYTDGTDGPTQARLSWRNGSGATRSMNVN